MKHLILPTMSSLLLLFIHFTTILAQSPAPAPGPPPPTIIPPPAPGPPPPTIIPPPAPVPPPPTPTPTSIPAPAPGPPPPTNITAILEKAGKFTTLIRVLKSTQSADRINTQLNTTSQGLTIFAPDDAAFAKLKSGTLNTYTDQKQAQLMQFHTISSFLSIPQFQTASNPLSTEAGGTNYGEFPLNVTTSGNSVNISTGFVNASIVDTIYTDNQLAVYEVDKVLLPESFFIHLPPPPPPAAPAPSPAKPKKVAQPSLSSTSDAVRVSLIYEMFHASFLIAAVLAATWLF